MKEVITCEDAMQAFLTEIPLASIYSKHTVMVPIGKHRRMVQVAAGKEGAAAMHLSHKLPTAVYLGANTWCMMGVPWQLCSMRTGYKGVDGEELVAYLPKFSGNNLQEECALAWQVADSPEVRIILRAIDNCNAAVTDALIDTLTEYLQA